MATAADPTLKKKSPQYLNLLPCPRWKEAVETGQIEFASRYRRQVNLTEFAAQALTFCAHYTGDELFYEMYDAYDFNKQRSRALMLTDELAARLKEFSEHLSATTDKYAERLAFASRYNGSEGPAWSNRYAICAALYVYSNHLLKFRDREILLPKDSKLEIQAPLSGAA